MKRSDIKFINDLPQTEKQIGEIVKGLESDKALVLI